MKKCFLLCFLSTPFFGLQAQENKADSLTKKEFLHKLVRNPLSLLPGSSVRAVKDSILTPPPIRKNVLYFQVLGDTPFLGMKYHHRFFEKNNRMMEAGVGIGFTPQLFTSDRYKKPPFPFSFSHSVALFSTRKKFVSPFIAYSGIFVSGNFYKGRQFNYMPAPSVGVRLGNINSATITLLWQMYLYAETEEQVVGENLIQRTDFIRGVGVPSISLQIPFRGNKNEK